MRLIKYPVIIGGNTLIGVEDTAKSTSDKLYVFFSTYGGERSYGINSDRIIESWDVVIHEMENKVNEKVINFEEENKMNEKVVKGNTGLGTTRVKTIEDSLSVAQEAMNNAYMAINGILQAHAEKNGEEVSPIEPIFTFDDFDKSVSRTWKKQDFKDAISNAALGLTGEAGEVADLIKKATYHGRGFMGRSYGNSRSINENDVKDELSDVLFYVSAMAQEFGFTLEDIARHNKEKLEKRYKEGFTTEESANKADKLVKISENRETGESYYV